MFVHRKASGGLYQHIPCVVRLWVISIFILLIACIFFSAINMYCFVVFSFKKLLCRVYSSLQDTQGWWAVGKGHHAAQEDSRYWR